MKKDTAKLVFGHNDTESPCQVFYVAKDTEGKLYVGMRPTYVNEDDKDLIAFEDSLAPNFMTWMFYDEWKDAKSNVSENVVDKMNAFMLYGKWKGADLHLPENITSRINKGITKLQDVKSYLKEEQV